MRSWAFFIFEAATISIALVILRVFCTLLILLRISFEPAIANPIPLEGAVFLEVFDGGGPSLFAFGVHVLGLLELIHQLAVLALDKLPQPGLERERFLDGNVVVITLAN